MSGIPQSQIRQIPFLWTHGVAGRETLHYLDRNGFDGEPLLSRAELSRGRLLEDPGGISFTANFTRRARYANSVGDTNRFNLALRLGLRICSMDCRVRNGIPEWYPGRDQGHRTQNRARARRRIATSQAERPNSWQSGTSEVHRLASAQVNRGRLKVLPGCKGEP